jgi:hypothetical protein
VPLKPLDEALKLLLCSATHCHLADGCYSSCVQCAAGHCSAGKAALLQLLQHLGQKWPRELQQLEGELGSN